MQSPQHDITRRDLLTIVQDAIGSETRILPSVLRSHPAGDKGTRRLLERARARRMIEMRVSTKYPLETFTDQATEHIDM
jgi:hypothetical protein